jgi:hypothetical protein
MTDTIGVELQAKGNIASEAKKASEAMAQLAAQEKKVQDVAKSLGTTDIAKVGKALNKVATSEKQAIAKKASEEKKNFSRETKYAKQDLGFLTKDKEMQDKILKILGPETAGALAGGIELAAGFGAAIAIGVVAATALAVAIGSAAVATGNARDSAQALMGVLTKGQGEKALTLVDGLAKQLGVKFEDARDAFIKFRESGLDNKQSAALLKLKADLDAVDPSGKLAEQAVSKVLDMKGGKGTSEEMALLAKQAGVVGDGAKAAAARFGTLNGALSSLDNTKTEALTQIFDKIKPSINAAAGKVAQFADAFLSSAKGQKVINAISASIVFLADTVAASIPVVASAFETVVDVGTKVYNAYQSVASIFQTNSTAAALASAAFGGLKIIGYALAGVLGIIVAGALLLAAPFIAAGAAVAVLVGAIGAGLGTLWDFVASVPKIGSAIIDGLIGGIMSKVASLKATIGNIAGAVSGGFKSALGINSPSKVFAEFGKHTATGYEQGVDKHMPDGKEFASSVSPGGSAAPVSSPGAAPSGGGLSVHIENLNVPVGVDPEPFSRAVRKELTLMLQMIQLSRGGALPGAV